MSIRWSCYFAVHACVFSHFYDNVWVFFVWEWVCAGFSLFVSVGDPGGRLVSNSPATFQCLLEVDFYSHVSLSFLCSMF